jgi:CarboxypepD_reg-like domain
MKPHHHSIGLAAAASVALMLASVACGDSNGSIVSPTPPVVTPAPTPVATFSISGTISEATESGAVPIEGVAVGRAETDDWVVTNADGFYRLSGLRLGMAHFVLSKAGYNEQAVEMTIEGDSQLDAVLVRQGSQSGAWPPRTPYSPQ